MFHFSFGSNGGGPRFTRHTSFHSSSSAQGHRPQRTASNDVKLYKILGVDKNASAKDIKQAYRKAVLKHHPDKGGDPDIFKDIQAAYSILSDEEKRKKYDSFGITDDSTPGQTQGRSPFGGGGMPNDLFEHMFGEMFSGHQRRQAQAQRHIPRPITQNLHVSIQEVYEGKVKKIKISNQGQEDIVHIPLHSNLQDGSKVLCQGKGAKNPTSNERGDLIIVIRIKSHKLYEHNGSELRMNVRINVFQALLGNVPSVVLPDGSTYEHSSTASPISQGTVLFVPGKGFPNKTLQRGGLRLSFTIEMPQKLTEKQIEHVKECLTL